MGEHISADDIKALEEKGDVEGLSQALQEGDLEAKKLAARALIDLANERALEPLISVLESVVDVRSDEGSTESDIRHYCILALKKLANPAAIDVLIKASAKSEEGYFDMDVAWALQAIGEPAKQPLIDVLDDDDDRRRSTAAYILGGIGGDDVSEALFYHICDNDPSVRNAVVMSLGKIKDPRSVGPLINRALNDEHGEIRKNAKEALEDMGVNVPNTDDTYDSIPLDEPGKILTYMRSLIKDNRADNLLSSLLVVLNEDDQLLLSIVGELGVDEVLSAINPAVLEQGEDYLEIVVALGETAMDFYISALHDEDEDVRYIAANALGAIGDARAVDSLIACLEDPDAYVRNSSVVALGNIGDRKAAKPLMDLAKKEDEDFIKDNIQAVVADMLIVPLPAGGEEAPSSPSEEDHDGDEEEIEQQELPKGVKGLLRVFESNDLKRSGKAAEALAEMGEEALPSVLDALSNNDANVRYYAVYTLEMMGDERSVGGLIGRLEEDEDWHVRQAAAIALGKMEAEEAISALVRASNSSSTVDPRF